jgi:nicotinamidase/pyrazinamidase
MEALVIIDMQNDFVSKDGALFFKEARKVILPIVDLIEEFKGKKAAIITTQDWHDREDKEFNKFPPHCIRGTRGSKVIKEIRAALVGYKPWVKIKKTRYSAFYKTNMDAVIEEYKIDKAMVVGVMTNICVLYTVEEFRNRDIETCVSKKCVATNDEKIQEFALNQMKDILGVKII